MSIGLVGRKVGMTRIFTDDGNTLPVTVLDVSDNRVAQIKTAEKDGYAAVQVAFGKRRASRVTKPLAGHLAKAAVEAGRTLREFRAKPEELATAFDGVVYYSLAENKTELSGNFTTKVIPEVHKAARTAGILKKDVDLSSAIDPRFVDAATK